MLGTLATFVEELRAVGVPVSMVEAIDAATALEHVDVFDRTAFRAALAATLVKNGRHRNAFDTAFDVFFGLAAPVAASETYDDAPAAPEGGQSGGGGDPEAEALAAAIMAALQSGDGDRLRRLVGRAVGSLAGFEPGRPVGGRYYLYRVLRRLDVDRMLELLRAAPGSGDDALEARVRQERAEELIDLLRAEVRREVIRRLVADRGPEAVARTLRRLPVEDLDLMHATREQLAEIERAVEPLARKLASRLAQRRRRGRNGRLDVRRTIRRSLSHGGVLLDPRFRAPVRSKPELVLICDVSGSMATFARFTMQLVYAIGNQFSRVRAFAFVDDLDEVTRFFGPGVDFHDALLAMGEEARLVWRDGHSDYGHALGTLASGFPDAVTAASTVLVTGDARNNYRATGVEVLADVAAKARATYWLNPEPARYWDTGDSIMSVYAPVCDGVHEVRTLGQLERFVEGIAAPRRRPTATAPHDAAEPVPSWRR